MEDKNNIEKLQKARLATKARVRKHRLLKKQRELVTKEGTSVVKSGVTGLKVLPDAAIDAEVKRMRTALEAWLYSPIEDRPDFLGPQ
jgi:hypothetical protein